MKTIAVIFGGRSAEHDISIITGISSVIKPLELGQKYNIEAIYIAKDGSWYNHEKLKDITLYTSGKIDEFLKNISPINLEFSNGLSLSKSSRIGGNKKVKVDLAFPATHGTYGEDGALMGLLEMAGIPYVGCSMPSSVLAMDKVLAKQIANENDIQVSSFLSIDRNDFENKSDETLKLVESRLKYPLFIKPAHLGSSIGISRVTNKTELQNAIEVAAHYDEKILIEEEINNLIEVTLPIMGNENPQPALLERPLTQAEDFFDFETKYLSGGKKGGSKKGGTNGAQGYSELPAKLEKKLYGEAVDTGIKVYKALGCSGIARVDMLIDSETNIIYFNEVNPLPGSLYSHNWRASGVSSVELVDKLIHYAEQRHLEKQRLTTSFSTNYLKQF